MTLWVSKNMFLAGEMSAWSVLYLISHRSQYNSPKMGREAKEEGIGERPERPSAFEEALDKLNALSEPQGGG